MAQSGIDGNHSARASQHLGHLLQAHTRQDVDKIVPIRQASGPRFFMGGAPRQFDTHAAVGKQSD
ncbi:Uncharacterised protein [Klebsiella pneumoniae]|nr:Uncharacterised protein [Klebsiella pneumoniae]